MFELLIVGLLIFITFFTKSYSEKRHYASIEKRESALMSKPITPDTLDLEDEHLTSSQIESSYLILHPHSLSHFHI